MFRVKLLQGQGHQPYPDVGSQRADGERQQFLVWIESQTQAMRPTLLNHRPVVGSDEGKNVGSTVLIVGNDKGLTLMRVTLRDFTSQQEPSS